LLLDFVELQVLCAFFIVNDAAMQCHCSYLTSMLYVSYVLTGMLIVAYLSLLRWTLSLGYAIERLIL